MFQYSAHQQYFLHNLQAQTAGKLARLFNSASGIYDVVNVCSTDEDDIEEENGGSVQPPMQVVCDMDTEEGVGQSY